MSDAREFILQTPGHELVNLESRSPSVNWACTCGRWFFGGVASTSEEKAKADQQAKDDFDKHAASTRFEEPADPVDPVSANRAHDQRAANLKQREHWKSLGIPEGIDVRKFILEPPTAPPPGWKITVALEKLPNGASMYVSKIWRDGRCVETSPTASELKEPVKKWAIERAWTYFKMENGLPLGEGVDVKSFIMGQKGDMYMIVATYRNGQRAFWDQRSKSLHLFKTELSNVIGVPPTSKWDYDSAVEALRDIKGRFAASIKWSVEPALEYFHEAVDPKEFIMGQQTEQPVYLRLDNSQIAKRVPGMESSDYWFSDSTGHWQRRPFAMPLSAAIGLLMQKMAQYPAESGHKVRIVMEPWTVEAPALKEAADPKEFIMGQPTYYVVRVVWNERAAAVADALGSVPWLDTAGAPSHRPVRMIITDATHAREVFLKNYTQLADDVVIEPAADQSQMFWQGRRWPEDFNESELEEALEEAVDPREFIMGQSPPTRYVVYSPFRKAWWSTDYDWTQDIRAAQRFNTVETAEAHFQGSLWHVDIQPVFEAVDPKEFIMGQSVPWVVRVRWERVIDRVPVFGAWFYLDHDGQFYEKPPNVFKFENIEDASRVYELNLRQFPPKMAAAAKVEFVPITHIGESVDPKEFIMQQSTYYAIAATSAGIAPNVYYLQKPIKPDLRSDRWTKDARYAARFDANKAEQQLAILNRLPTDAWLRGHLKDFRIVSILDVREAVDPKKFITGQPTPPADQALGESTKEMLIGSVAVICKDKVCLVNGKNGWTLPGGRAEDEESIFHAASRETAEECGIKVKPADLIFVGLVKRAQHRTDSIFVHELEKEQPAKPGSDAEEAMWCSLDKLPELGMGHAQAIKKALRVLKMKPEERGQLVVFEGVDGSGKTVQCDLTVKWLKKHGFPVIETKWNSSPIISPSIKKAKKTRELSPVLYHLLHSADMLHRYEQVVLPALGRNFVVVCDRYWPTGIVRDRLRGVKDKAAYTRLRKPDVLFYCSVNPEVAVKRLMKAGRLSWYGLGMDLNYADDEQENALEYSKRMKRMYDRTLPASHVPLNMGRKIDKIFKDVKAKLERKLHAHYFHGQNIHERAEAAVDRLLEAVDVRDFIDANAPKKWRVAGTAPDGAKLYMKYIAPNYHTWEVDAAEATLFGPESARRTAKSYSDVGQHYWVQDVRVEPAVTEAIDVRQFIQRQPVVYNITGTHRESGKKTFYTVDGYWANEEFVPPDKRWRGGPDQAEHWVYMLQGEQDAEKPAIIDMRPEAELKEAIDVRQFIAKAKSPRYRVTATSMKPPEHPQIWLACFRKPIEWTHDREAAAIYDAKNADIVLNELRTRITWMHDLRLEMATEESLIK